VALRIYLSTAPAHGTRTCYAGGDRRAPMALV
jgi:hypothetical protein